MPKRGPGQCRPCALSWTHRCYRDTVTGISGNLAVTALLSFREMTGQVSFQPHRTFSPPSPPRCLTVLATQPRDPSRDCVDQPELANCDLILQARLCGNEYYSSFCCASCSRVQPPAQPVWQQGHSS